MQGVLEETTRVVSKSMFKRHGRMLPAVKDLEAVGEYANPVALGKVKDTLAKANARFVETKGRVRPIFEYSMDAPQVTAEYIRQMANTHAWTMKTIKDPITGKTNGLGESLVEWYFRYANEKSAIYDPLRADMLGAKLIPMALGRMTPKAAMRAMSWSNSLVRYSDWLETPVVKAVLPKEARGTMQKWLLDGADQFAMAPASRAIAGYLYLSTLGGNPAAAARNLFQIALTTGPLVGKNYVWKGMTAALNQPAKYFDLRFGKGLPHTQAFSRAFDRYFRAGLPKSPIFEETVGNLLAGTYDQVAKAGVPLKASGAATATQKGKQALMSLFGASEHAVRLVSFEAAMAKGAAEGLSLEASIPLARQVVQETQFVAGVAGLPNVLMGRAPLTRQLMQFPLRLLEFTTNVALRAGSGTKALGEAWGPMAGMNPGTFARMYIWSDLIAEVGTHVFGTDLDQSLLSGALPTFRTSGALAPLPIVPPAISVAMAPFMDIARGDVGFEETRRIAPLLMPGGVGLARAVGSMPIPGGEEAARFLMRRYVDYDKQTSDGR
jgi:hypothetical protein